jgi:pyruvate dehydrogenase E2 component (dihydrolipoamide acetyltransferase)
MSDKIRAITMPKWGLAMEEGMVTAWLAEEGKPIENGQEILEIETTKITNVYEAPQAGLLRRRVVPEGETVPVGALLGLLAENSISEEELDVFVDRFNAEFAVKAAEAEAQAPEPEKIEADGQEINFLRMGEGEGIPLILIHGFGGDLNNWLFNQSALAEGREVIALDLPGHGRSVKEVGDGDLTALTAALGAFLKALDLGCVYLAGHSLGGAVALAHAVKNPEAVAGLALLAPAGLGDEINGAFIDGFIAAGRRKDMRGVLESLVADPALISRDMVNDVLKYKRLDGVDQALKHLAGGLFPEGRQARLSQEDLARLSVPITVIWGREDRILPAAHAEALAGKARLHVLEGVGHMPHMEAAAEVNRLIAEVLA